MKRATTRTDSLRRIREKAFYYAVLGGYLWLWSRKTEIRDKYLKRLGLGVLSISPALLVCEYFADIFHRRWLDVVVAWSKLPDISWPVIVLPPLGLLYLIWHHWREARKPSYEYTFVRRLCDFLEGVKGRHAQGFDAALGETLELLFSLFQRAGVKHVAIHLEKDGLLTIAPKHVYPKEAASAFYVVLKPKEGVAGAVFDDLKPRYVPRVSIPFRKRRYVPTISFPHALIFAFEEIQTGGHRRFELGDDDIDPGIVKEPEDGEMEFQSFLSVPIKLADNSKCYGVLSFDFGVFDPLDRGDIAMAAVFGVLLGEEMRLGGRV